MPGYSPSYRHYYSFYVSSVSSPHPLAVFRLSCINLFCTVVVVVIVFACWCFLHLLALVWCHSASEVINCSGVRETMCMSLFFVHMYSASRFLCSTVVASYRMHVCMCVYGFLPIRSFVVASASHPCSITIFLCHWCEIDLFIIKVFALD